jgi:hypothetical protein
MIRPLANDEKGIPFDVPEDAKVWRVQKASNRRGHFAAVWRDARPLELPIDADQDELLAALEDAGDDAIGKYRLAALDGKKQPCCGEDYAVVVLTAEVADDERRNAAPPIDAVAKSVTDGTLRALTETVAEQNKLVGRLVEEITKIRENELKAMRQGYGEATSALSAVAQTLAGRRLPMPPAHAPEYGEAEEDQEAAGEAPPQTLVEQLAPLMPMVMQAWERMKGGGGPPPSGAQSESNAPATAANGTAGGGLGIHAAQQQAD